MQVFLFVLRRIFPMNRSQKNKIMSIINICNAIKPSDKEDVKFWISKVKENCEEVLR